MGPIEEKEDMKRAVCVVHLCNEVDFTIIIFHANTTVQDPTKEPMRLTKTKRQSGKQIGLLGDMDSLAVEQKTNARRQGGASNDLKKKRSCPPKSCMFLDFQRIHIFSALSQGSAITLIAAATLLMHWLDCLAKRLSKSAAGRPVLSTSAFS
jgi:hypothetical protein